MSDTLNTTARETIENTLQASRTDAHESAGERYVLYVEPKDTTGRFAGVCVGGTYLPAGIVEDSGHIADKDTALSLRETFKVPATHRLFAFRLSGDAAQDAPRSDWSTPFPDPTDE